MSTPTVEQLRAIALLRWQLFVNSLRSIRGRLNLVSRAFAGILIALAGIGGGVAIGVAAYGIAAGNRLTWLAVLFWLISLFWQLFPITATTFTQNIDTTSLLRFPLTYRGYFLVRLVYGVLDIATILCLCWSLGLLIGVSAARVRLAPWVLASVILFVLFNLLLSRAVFVWIEHWLSRRRGREIMSIVFLLLMVGMQMIGPVMSRQTRQPHLRRYRTLERFAPVLEGLPPGLPAVAMSEAANGRSVIALACLAFAVAYTGAAGHLLHARLYDQYRGENPQGGGKRQAESRTEIRRGWKLPLFAAPVSAVFEKELRYFSRSVPMLFTMIMPLVVIFVLWGGRRGFLGSRSEFFLPVGAAYSLLIMTNIVYNSFGGDGAGVQFFLVSPVPFRQIAFAKNLAQLAVLSVEVFILWLGIRVVYSPPNLRVVLFTIAWCLFAVPLNFAAGNLLSVYSPKRIDLATFGRQRAAEATILVSLVVQLTGIGFGVLAVFVGLRYSTLWMANVTMLGLSVATISGYFILLRRIDGLVMSRREVLATELFRA